MDTEAVIEAADVIDGRPPGPDRKEHIIRMVALFVMPFLMVTMMFATYMATMHSPHPRDMPVAVVGSGAPPQALVDGLNAAPGKPPTPAGAHPGRRCRPAARPGSRRRAGPARRRRRQRDDPHRLGGRSLAGRHRPAVARAGGRGATAGRPRTEDVAPLPDGDRAGIAVLFAAMGMMLAGYVPLSLLLMARSPPAAACDGSCPCWPAGPRSPARSSGSSSALSWAPSRATTSPSSASACSPPQPSAWPSCCSPS